jgi:subtilase family serine protease
MCLANSTRWTALLLLSIASLDAASRPYLRGHVPEAIAASTAVGKMARLDRLTVAIGLPLRNQDELKILLDQVVDPHSPSFRHYLTPRSSPSASAPRKPTTRRSPLLWKLTVCR